MSTGSFEQKEVCSNGIVVRATPFAANSVSDEEMESTALHASMLQCPNCQALVEWRIFIVGDKKNQMSMSAMFMAITPRTLRLDCPQCDVSYIGKFFEKAIRRSLRTALKNPVTKGSKALMRLREYGPLPGDRFEQGDV